MSPITKCLPFDEGILLYEDQTLNPQEPKENEQCKIHIREQAVAFKKKNVSEYTTQHKENIRIYLECHCFSTQWVTNNHEAMSNNHHLINLRKKIKGDPSTA